MKDMLQLRLSQYTDSLPKTAIPLATDFKLDIPGASQSLHMQTIPANNSFLSGNLSIPAIQLSEPLSIRSIVFLKEGLLVGLVNGPAITTAISTAAGEMPSNLASVIQAAEKPFPEIRMFHALHSQQTSPFSPLPEKGFYS